MKHIHDTGSNDWHAGSLADCPETKWVNWIILDDGRQARMAIGMSVSAPPETANRNRRIVNAPDIV